MQESNRAHRQDSNNYHHNFEAGIVATFALGDVLRHNSVRLAVLKIDVSVTISAEGHVQN